MIILNHRKVRFKYERVFVIHYVKVYVLNNYFMFSVIAFFLSLTNWNTCKNI